MPSPGSTSPSSPTPAAGTDSPSPARPSDPRKPVDLSTESVAGEEDPGAALDDVPAVPSDSKRG